MIKDWQELSKLIGDKRITVERVRLTQSGIAIEGEFELPPLARLSAEAQVFLAAFVKCHGSIKQMEKYFGVSYPTIKNRLNRLAEKFEFIEIEPAPDKGNVLDRLDRGEISVDEAIEILNKGGKNE
jgi:hypothetical protein